MRSDHDGGLHQTLRSSFSNAIVTDVISVTPLALTVVMASPGAPPPHGFVQLQAHYTGSQLVSLFGVNNFSGSVMYPDDQTLDLAQSVAKFQTLSSDSALLIGRINRATGACSAVAQANAGTLRATASIFKIWVLGGLADEIAAGRFARTGGLRRSARPRGQAPCHAIQTAGSPLRMPHPIGWVLKKSILDFFSSPSLLHARSRLRRINHLCDRFARSASLHCAIKLLKRAFQQRASTSMVPDSLTCPQAEAR
ncbi:MAG: hypothetical protein K8F35_09365 [Dokdonella sp.]|uniref:hypothetical protein n=1 Tax=Dokdonella sp. TaxID=2291710 RepID=UPI0025C6C3E8|nr:hypothetical protein [Dokdonella sp.]MBZ0223226.1 hypothetical protein [Dokdonella sp.]